MAQRPPDVPRTVGRWALAAVLGTACIGHLVKRREFLAQVPPLLPARNAVVYVSGAIELGLAVALAWAPPHRRAQVGRVVAGFFMVVFPGNVSQAVTGTDAFGLNSTRARLVRLLFQPVLVGWALWATGAERPAGHKN